MRVRAKEAGYAGTIGADGVPDYALRAAGDVFEIDDEIAKAGLARAGGTWFEPLDEPKAKGKTNKDDPLV